VRAFGRDEEQAHLVRRRQDRLHLLHTLFQTSLSYPQIRRFDEYFVTTLLVDEGRARGVVAIRGGHGRVEGIGGQGLILATGGAAGVPVHHQRQHQDR